jgi:hypothetical protein
MLQKIRAAVKNSIKAQYVISLTIMWAGGLAICIYLLGSTTKKDIVDELNFFAFSNKTTLPKDLNSETYVFVNVNQKHFLTRFVASVTNEEETDNKKINAPVTKIIVEKTANKITPATEKKPADFSIKQAPEL